MGQTNEPVRVHNPHAQVEIILISIVLALSSMLCMAYKNEMTEYSKAEHTSAVAASLQSSQPIVRELSAFVLHKRLASDLANVACLDSTAAELLAFVGCSLQREVGSSR